MRWLSRLWDPTPDTQDDREDAEALDELRVASKEVRRRSARIIEDFEELEQERLRRRAR